MIFNRKMNSHNLEIEVIRGSGLFLEDWYLREYGKLGGEYTDPVAHYYFVGWKEGKNPNPYFDSAWYLEQIGRTVADGFCPLLEYIRSKDKLPTSLGFDSHMYSIRYQPDGRDPLEHYIDQGVEEGFSTFPEKLNFQQIKFEVESCGLFDANWYLMCYPDIAEAAVDPLSHYCMYGWKEGRHPNKYFDSKWYLEQSNHSEIMGVPALVHYVKEGWKDGQSPSKQFDTSYYLRVHPDVKAAGLEPLKHYIDYGEKEGRTSRPVYSLTECGELLDTGLFLQEWYENQYEDLRDSGIDFVQHFVIYGRKECRNPNPYFDTGWYAEQYGNEIPDKQCPIVFYSNVGWTLGHSPSVRFDSKAYSEKYLDCSDEIEPLRHFLEHGKKTGCKAIPIAANQSCTYPRLLKINPSANLVSDPALRPLLDRAPCPLSPPENSFDPNALQISWVIPDFSPGAGGHMTIFRMVRFFEFFGHSNKIWIYNPSFHSSANDAYDDIVKHFQVVKAEVEFVTQVSDFGEGDAIFATDWSSVSFVLSAKKFKRRFYFVQDHEPEFYPQGSKAILAKKTYSEDLDCICASPWLRQLMESKYGRWASDFWLAVDRDIYFPVSKVSTNSGKKKIAFYARHFTSRRAVELGFLALEALCKVSSEIEVHCFGAELPFDEAPFDCISHGVLSPEQLAKLYRECDLGVVFSATNYSLIPQEMMACGLPIAELDVDSTRAIFPQEAVTFLDPNPLTMASQLQELLSNEEVLERQSKAALDWVGQFDWERSAKDVESAILGRLGDLGFMPEEDSCEENPAPKASVIIPTWNGGEIFKRVIEMLERQHTPWKYEILVVDSGSVDGTVEFVQSRPNVRLHQIPNSEFQHGKTRNLAVSLTTGEYIAVLTQDALPKDDSWLYNLVTHLERFPEAAGAFGKHLAWPGADPYTKRDLDNHFARFLQEPICVSRNTDRRKWEEKDLGWRQFLHFYSDNNSCMRRSVWEKIPYPEVEFGEDQAWAWEVIKAGYSKVYACQATVYHSHDFDEGDVEKRSYEEGRFFRKVFAYKLIDVEDVESPLRHLNIADESWGRENDLPDDIIERRKSANRMRVEGYRRAHLEEIQ